MSNGVVASRCASPRRVSAGRGCRPLYGPTARPTPPCQRRAPSGRPATVWPCACEAEPGRARGRAHGVGEPREPREAREPRGNPRTSWTARDQGSRSSRTGFQVAPALALALLRDRRRRLEPVQHGLLWALRRCTGAAMHRGQAGEGVRGPGHVAARDVTCS